MTKMADQIQDCKSGPKTGEERYRESKAAHFGIFEMNNQNSTYVKMNSTRKVIFFEGCFGALCLYVENTVKGDRRGEKEKKERKRQKEIKLTSAAPSAAFFRPQPSLAQRSAVLRSELTKKLSKKMSEDMDQSSRPTALKVVMRNGCRSSK